MKSPYYYGERNQNYIKPQYVSSILSSADKNYNQIVNKSAIKENINNKNIDSKPGLFNLQNSSSQNKSYTRINMLNGRKNYYNRSNIINKFLSQNCRDFDDEPAKSNKNNISSEKNVNTAKEKMVIINLDII